MEFEPLHEINSRGVGEGGMIGAPAAICNAVSDALAPLGVEVEEQHLSPEYVRSLITSASDGLAIARAVSRGAGGAGTGGDAGLLGDDAVDDRRPEPTRRAGEARTATGEVVHERVGPVAELVEREHDEVARVPRVPPRPGPARRTPRRCDR